MTRADFIKTMHATIDAFDRRWTEQQKDESENPENWPDELNEADWLEQFEAHVQTTGLEVDPSFVPRETERSKFIAEAKELVAYLEGPEVAEEFEEKMLRATK